MQVDHFNYFILKVAQEAKKCQELLVIVTSAIRLNRGQLMPIVCQQNKASLVLLEEQHQDHTLEIS